jgi:hypothetical protein
VEVADPADDRRQVDDVRAALDGPARLVEHPQVAAMDLAALAHPPRGLALVGDADLVGRVAQEPADDRGADGAGTAGDEDTLHPGQASAA